jgi:tripartite-type tricarboxylate transporter receptor subunit TctC
MAWRTLALRAILRLPGRILVFLAMCLPAFLTTAFAEESEQAFYSGKTVHMIVGSGAGGGYDAISRLIAPYLAKTLGATVVVENQPGAGGLVALNRLYLAPPDGLQISLANGTAAAFAQLTARSGIQFDLTKFGYVASVREPPGVWLVGANSPIREVSQAVQAKMKWRWGSTGGTSTTHIRPAFTCEALALDCHIVAGYKSTADAGLAVARGEMDALYASEASAFNYVRAKQNWAVATIPRNRSRFLPDRPTIFEAAKMNAGQTWVMDFLADVESLGRIVVAPPGLPTARLAYLQEAMTQALHNPQLIADGEKAGWSIDYLDPVSTHKNAVAVVSGVTPEQKQRVLGILARAR